MTVTGGTKLEPGQVWLADDGRRMILTGFDGDRAVLRNDITGKVTKVRQDRLLAGSGYTLTVTVSLIPDAIRDFVDEKGFSPTVRELATKLEVPVPTMHRRLVALRDAGIINWVDGAPRTLTVL
jgi:DNA-binding transcriptional ArsR family regulator